MRAAAIAWALVVAGCAGGPPVPDWQRNAQASAERAVAAYLSGNDRAAAAEFDRARSEVARTGRVELAARVELMRCAAQAASLQFGRCEGFERLRIDAPPAERAYADYLGGGLDLAGVAWLPSAQQLLAAPARDPAADLAALRSVDEPLSRLLGAALWLQSSRATPEVLALAVDTASAQGWRRPLAAWLAVQQRRAEQAGDRDEAARLARRIDLVLGGAATR